PEVIPGGGVRQIEGSLSSIWLQHWVDEERRAEHELITNVANSDIGAPIHYQWPLDGVVVICYSPCQGIDIGHEAVAQLVVVDKNRLDPIEGPDLILRTVTMRAKNRAEGSVLEPACIEFLEFRVLHRVVMRRPIPANIGCPIGVSGEREVQPCRHLVAQPPIGAIDVT